MFIGEQEQANQANGPIVFVSMPHLPTMFYVIDSPNALLRYPCAPI